MTKRLLIRVRFSILSFNYQLNFCFSKIKDVELLVDNSLPPEQYREPAIDKDQKIKKQLEELRKDLGKKIDPAKQTPEDIINQDNIAQGRDKYKTLKQIRLGNTKKRIDEFESM
jgi:hypothetical protein